MAFTITPRRDMIVSHILCMRKIKSVCLEDKVEKTRPIALLPPLVRKVTNLVNVYTAVVPYLRRAYRRTMSSLLTENGSGELDML